MTDNYQKIFGSTECVSSEMLIKYKDGKLSKEEMYKVEKHLVDCEMCRDELDGYLLMDEQKITDLFELKKKINPQLRKQTKFNPKVVFYMAAALIPLIIVVWLWQLSPQSTGVDDKITENIERNNDNENHKAVSLTEEENEEPIGNALFEESNQEDSVIEEESTEQKVESNELLAKEENEQIKNAEIKDVEKVEPLPVLMSANVQQTESLEIAEDVVEEAEDEIILAEKAESEEMAKDELDNITEEQSDYKIEVLASKEEEKDVLESSDYEDVSEETNSIFARKKSDDGNRSVSAKAPAQTPSEVEVEKVDISTLIANENYNAAITELKVDLASNPNNVNNQYNLGYCYFKIAKYKESIKTFKRIENKETGKQDQINWYLALAYIKTEKKSKAKIYLNKLIESGSIYAGQAQKKLNELE